MPFLGRNFLVLWQGQLVSQLGSQAFLIATTYYVLETTGSATLVAATMMASTVPLVVLSPIGGTFADRHSRRTILVATDLLRAVIVGGLGAFLLWAPFGPPKHTALVIAIAALGGVMEALFSPAIQALIPELVPGKSLTVANSVSQISRQVSSLVGQALGGLLYVAWGAGVLLLLDALSFAYGGIASWFLPSSDKRPNSPTTVRIAMREYASATVEGVTYVWRRRGMTAVLLTFAGVNFLFMPVFVLLPFYTTNVLGGGAEWYGFLLGAVGAGALMGSLAAGFIVARVHGVAALVGLCVGGVGFAVLVLAATRVAAVALAAFFTIGLLSSVINVIVITAFQAAVPSNMRGRVMAVVIAISTAAAPLGMGLGGVLGSLWSEALPVVFAGCGITIGVLMAASWRFSDFGEALVDTNARSRSLQP